MITIYPANRYTNNKQKSTLYSPEGGMLLGENPHNRIISKALFILLNDKPLSCMQIHE